MTKLPFSMLDCGKGIIEISKKASFSNSKSTFPTLDLYGYQEYYILLYFVLL